MGRDDELAARHLADFLGEDFFGTIDGVQRLREAGREAPAQRGTLRMHGRCGTCGQNTGNAGVFDNGTTIHGLTPTFC
jgi:hypothetical protein